MLTVSRGINNIEKGDKIVLLNGHKITDLIDFRFYLEDQNDLEIVRKNSLKKLKNDVNHLRQISFIQDIPAVKKCVNKCKFCFIDQLPPGLRKSLYFKDDEWRLSFLTGNFTTLTNINRSQLHRIVMQRISPLYISLHATRLEYRQMLGLKNEKDILPKLQELDANGITTHLQVVLCPDINDGVVLKKTLDDLEGLKNIKSIGLVPVGLTKYHRNSLQSFNPKNAKELINQIQPIQSKYKKRMKINWVYLADEFYLMARRPVPKASYYDDFDQIENGIGLVRRWLDGFNGALSKGTSLAKPRMSPSHKFIIITGELFGPVIKGALSSLSMLKKFKVQAIKNNFFGSKITVAGLITAKDIIEQVKETKEPILIPDIMVNEDNLFLDNISFDELKNSLPRAHLVPSTAKGFVDWLGKHSKMI